MIPIGSAQSVLVYYFSEQKSLPDDFQAYESSRNGDCLFNSVSLALFGNEHYANRLRLAAVVDGITNSKVYIKVCIFLCKAK